MKADFSRLRQDPDSGVLDEWLQQQGRVWLDSDWNESTLSRLRQLEAHVLDLVGGYGRPEPGTAFRLGMQPASGALPDPALAGDFRIGGGSGPAGHAYVGGVLAANPTPCTYFTQPDYPRPPALPVPSIAATGWQLVGDLGTARAGHAAAMAGVGASRMPLVCGGASSAVAVASAERYTASTSTWSPAAAMRVARLDHTATALSDGRVLVAGGTGGGGSSFASAEIFDPAADTWTLTGSMSSARSLHTATLLPDGRVLVCGGFGQRLSSVPSLPQGPDNAALNSAEIYDPATGAWTPAPALTGARADHRAVLIPASSTAGSAGGSVLITGGQNNGVALASVELYTPATNSWSSLAQMGAARESHTVTVLADGRVLITGGVAAGVVLAACEAFTPSTESWSPAASLAGPRANHIAAVISGDQVLVAGGYAQGASLSSAELFDGARNTWRTARALHEPRAAHTVTVLNDGSVLVAGGTSAAGQPPALPVAGSAAEVPTAELYHPTPTTSAFAYLEVWRRLVTYLQDDQREVALGGPDTTVRARTVAQVKVLSIPADHSPDGLDCAHAAAYLPDDGAGRLSTLTVDPDPPSSPCDLSDVGVFSGGRNLLYRVEIHDSGQMLGAPAPADIPLTVDAAAGATTLTVAAMSAGLATTLTVGRWELVTNGGPADSREAVDIQYADPAGVVTLRVGLRSAASVAAGATLQRHRDTIVLATATSAGATSVRVDPELGRRLAESSTGALAAPAWFLRSGAVSEQVDVQGIDLATGWVRLGADLGHAYPAGAELVVRARYKWSADNASFATAVTGVLSSDSSAGSTTLQVASLGRDATTALHSGDIVELAGDADDLGRGVGILAHIVGEPDPDALTLTVDVADPNIQPSDAAAIAADHLVLRRWDGIGYVTTDAVDLGQGVKIQFSGYDFVASSYWWFTARTATGAVEELDAAPPKGIERRRMPLGLLRWTGDDESGVLLDFATDCVPIFDPLTDLRADHIAYDDSVSHLDATNVQDAIEALAPGRYPAVAAGGLNWTNDRELAIAAFNKGLTVTFTELMHAGTLTKDTFRVRVHVPDESTSLTRVLELPGTVSTRLISLHHRPMFPLPHTRPHKLPTGGIGGVAGAITATFTPSPALEPLQVGQWLAQLRSVDPGAKLRVDVVLDGDKILDWSGAHALDGNTLGRLGHDAYSTFIDLRLPSGDGRQGGAFESWLYLAAPPAPVQVAEIDPPNAGVTDAPPQVIHVMFTKDVKAPIAQSSIEVRGPAGDQLAGTFAPFPFTPNADFISGVTFTPSAGTSFTTVGQYTVIVRGTGATPITDIDGLPLDGQGRGLASDFSSTFTVVSAE